MTFQFGSSLQILKDQCFSLIALTSLCKTMYQFLYALKTTEPNMVMCTKNNDQELSIELSGDVLSTFAAIYVSHGQHSAYTRA